MSESSAFANYSNTTRALQSGAGQQQQSQNEQDAPYKGLIPTF